MVPGIYKRGESNECDRVLAKGAACRADVRQEAERLGSGTYVLVADRRVWVFEAEVTPPTGPTVTLTP